MKMRNFFTRLLKNRFILPLVVLLCFFVLTFTLAGILWKAKIKDEVTTFGSLEFYAEGAQQKSASILVHLLAEEKIFKHWKVGDQLRVIVAPISQDGTGQLELEAKISQILPVFKDRGDAFLMVIRPVGLEKERMELLNKIVQQGEKEKIRIIARSRSLFSTILNKKGVDLFI